MNLKIWKNKALSFILALVMVIGLGPVTVFAADDITVYVSLENTTYTDASAAWSGEALDKYAVTVPAGTSLMQATKEAFEANGLIAYGYEGGYIYSIAGLSAMDGSGSSGWMITVNDWFINAGADAFTAEDGDEVRWMFTSEGYGEDLGGTFFNDDTSLKALSFSEGVLSPGFAGATYAYTLTLPADCDGIFVTPTAANKNYQVRTNVSATEYKRNAIVPVADGTVITVGCGDPSWPSMNGAGTLTAYQITIAHEEVETPHIPVAPIDVTVRIEGYDMTLAPKAAVHVTNFDLAVNGLAVNGIPADTVTPLHALVQLLCDMGIDPADFGTDAIDVGTSGLLKGLLGLANTSYQSWMYSVNGEMPIGASALINQHALFDGDDVTFFYVDWLFAYQSWFDAEEKSAVAGQPVDFTLNGIYIADWMFGGDVETEAIEGAELYVSDGSNVIDADTPTGVLTDENGQASYTFDEPGTYLVSAVRVSEYDDETIDLSRPYCFVTVEAAPVVVPPVTLPELQSDWPNARGNAQNMGIVSARTPRTADEASLAWYIKYGTGYFDTPNTAVIVDDHLIFSAGSKLYKVNKSTNAVVTSTAMVAAPSFGITSITYGGGMVFAPISNGRIQAFNADTLDSLWISEPMTGQSLSPIVYADGYVYTGFWSSEVGVNYYVCLSVTDEDTENATETKSVTWKHAATGGYYWSGGVVRGDYIIFGSDNGVTEKEGVSKIYAVNRITGAQADVMEGPVGDQRSGIAYDAATDRLYFTTKAGYVNTVKFDTATGKFLANSFVSKQLVPNWEATGTPVVHGGILFVGTGAGVGGSGAVVAADAETLEIIDSVNLIGYPQGSPLLSTAYEQKEGKLYLYITYNQRPGGLTVVVYDKATQSLSKSELFTPPTAAQNYCIDSVMCDTDGTLYYHNDSTYLFAIKNIAEPETEPEILIAGVSAAFGGADIALMADGEASYRATVPYAYATADIKVTSADGAFVTVNGAAVDAQGIAAVSLTAGAANTIVVKANKGEQAETVTIVITREANNEPPQSETLINSFHLEFDETAISLSDDGSDSYSASVAYGVSYADVFVNKVANADVTVNGAALSSSDRVRLSLAEGVNTLTIVAALGAQTETKIITITRAAYTFDRGATIGHVNLTIRNTTFAGGAFTGTIVNESNFAIGANDTMMTAVLRALAQNGYGWTGTGGTRPGGVGDYGISYLASITKDGRKLGEFDGEPGSGWMGLLNDWFVSQGFQQFGLADGDVIAVAYTQNLGADIGGSWHNATTALESLSTDAGTLLPDFSSSVLDYTLRLPRGASSVKLTPSAINKNYLVKMFLNEQVPSDAEGSSFYKRTQDIPVQHGDTIYIGIGEPAWPSMNSQGAEAGTYAATWYKVKIEIEGQAGGAPGGNAGNSDSTITIGDDTVPLGEINIVGLVGKVKDKAMTITVTSAQGTALQENAKENAAQFGKGTILLGAPGSDEEIVSYCFVIPAAELAKFRNTDVYAATPLGNAKLPASLVNKLAAKNQELRIVIEQGSLIVKLMLGNEEVMLKNLGETIRIEIPYTPAPGENAMLAVAKSGGGIVQNSQYAGGYIHALVSETGRYTAVSNAKYFADTEGKWMNTAALYLAARGIVNGVSANLFAPETNMTRAMLVTVLYNYESRPTAGKNNPFGDVESGKWYTDAVLWAAQSGIVSGYGDGTFRPNESITREQVAVILRNYSAAKGYNTSGAAALNTYADASQIASWAIDAMKWARAENLLSGRTATTIAPKGIASRGEVAQMIMNYIEKYVLAQ